LEPDLILQPLRLEGKRHLEVPLLVRLRGKRGNFLIVLVVVVVLGLLVVGKSRSQSETAFAYIKRLHGL
jgi:hypothetical protein